MNNGCLYLYVPAGQGDATVIVGHSEPSGHGRQEEDWGFSW